MVMIKSNTMKSWLISQGNIWINRIGENLFNWQNHSSQLKMNNYRLETLLKQEKMHKGYHLMRHKVGY